MKKQAIFVLGLMFIFSGFVFGQAKTVTNATLDKYRQKRLQAERDLRENYQEMGFPSPEEMDRQNEESSRLRADLAQQLRDERLEKERIQLERERMNLDRQMIQQNNRQDNYSPAYNYPNPGFIDYSRYGSSSYVYPGFYGQGVFSGNRRGNFNQNRRGNFYNNRRLTNFYGRDAGRNNGRRPGIRPGGRGFYNQPRLNNRGGSRVVFSIGGRIRGN